jgi:hypothetical protein
MSINVGPVELPRWAVIALICGVTAFVMQQGKFPRIYPLLGISVPLQDLAVAGFIVAVILGFIYQGKNI